MRLPRLLAALGFTAVIALPLPALAADDTTITHVEPKPDGISVLVNVPAGSKVDLNSVAVTVNGQEVQATAAPAKGESITRTTILTVDVSNSMEGERFAAAKAAASAYLTTVPSDVKVGIVTFAGEVTEALEPTVDRAAAQAVLDGLTLTRQTRLYDGVLAATEMAGTEGQRSVLVLSDGADTSDTELSDVTNAIAESGVLVDVVTLDAGGGLTELTALSTAGNGRVISADPEALEAAFSAEAEVLARQVLVSATLPPDLEGTDATINVELTSEGQVLTDEVFAPVRVADTGPQKNMTLPSADRGMKIPEWGKWAAIGLVGLGLVGFLAALLPAFAKKEMTAEERVALYTAGGGTGPGAEQARQKVDQLAQAKGAAEAVLRRNKSLEDRIARRLDAADSGLRASEWLLLHAGIVLVAGLLGLVIGGGGLLVGLMFLALGFVLPWFYLGFKKRRRFKKFNASLPDTLQLMSGSLAAGLSLAQSVDTIVREGTEPMASEFKRVLVETRLGVGLEDAMEGIVERFDSKDFAWVVMAIRIQRQVGGNLAELLNKVADTIREREYMRRQVQALAAEGKISAYVLGGLPPGFLAYLMITKPDYVGVLFTNPIGWAMLGGAGLMLAVGAFWMSRLIKVEV